MTSTDLPSSDVEMRKANKKPASLLVYGVVPVDPLTARWGYRKYDDGTAVWFLLRWATSPGPSPRCRGPQEGAS